MTNTILNPRYITFDCYGTLTDFQMSALTRNLLADRVAAENMEHFLDTFEAYRMDEVLGAYKYYPELVKSALRRACTRCNVEYRESDGDEITNDVPNWGPHPDVPAALAKIADHFPLVIFSNAADKQIGGNVEKLGAPFHAVFTAEQAQAYKPQFRAFEYMFEQLGCEPEDCLHVSSSLRYDLIPAHELGIKDKVYVNRGYEPSVPYYQYHEITDLSGLPTLLGL